MNRRAHSGVLVVALLLTAASASASEAGERVYVAKLRAAEGVDESATNALEEAVLVAAKKARPDMTVLGRSDVTMLAELNATQAAAGCDTESCAAEIADALGAPQIVTGKLARVGSTWILSLTRLERGSLLVLARESVEKQGHSAEILVGEIPNLTARVFGEAPPSMEFRSSDLDDDSGRSGGGSSLGVAGGVMLGVGGTVLALGAVGVGYSFLLFQEAAEADDRGDTDTVREKVALGEPLNVGGWGAVAVGAAVAGVGGVLLWLGGRE